MGLFDSNKNTDNKGYISTPQSNGFKSREIVFSNLPENLEQFKSLPQAAMTNPFDTAAMAVLAFCYYPHNSSLSLERLSTYATIYCPDRGKSVLIYKPKLC